MKDTHDEYWNEKIMEEEFEAYEIRLKVPRLNVRLTPSNKAKVIDVITPGNYTIIEEKDGFGLLKSHEAKRDGWVSLEFVKRI